MTENPYIKAQRAKYDKLRESINAVLTRAAEKDEDLTDDQFRSVQGMTEEAEKIAKEIEYLVETEERSARVTELSAQVLTDGKGDGDGTAQVRGSDGRPATRTQDRDPGHYRAMKDGGEHSFFGDIYRKQNGDEQAAQRLNEHSRALSTGSQGVGVVPPKWLTDEFELIARQGRYLANAVRNVDLGDDPRPMTLPKQTAGTDAVVAEQSAENDPVGGADAWDSDVDTVTPKATAGKQTVSRQMLDMSTPAIDQLIFGDLMAVYNLKIESKVGAAVLAAAGTAVTTLATDAAFAADAAAIDAVVDTSIAVRNARKLPANLLVMTVNRWGKFKKLKDTSNRPLIPVSTYGPANVVGIGSVQVDGQVEDLPVIATDGVGNGTTFPESVIAMRSTDTILFESNTMRFRYEEQAGPESIVLGIWGYSAVIVRQAGKSVKRFVITAASA